MLRTAAAPTLPAWPDPAGFSGTDVLRQPPGYLDLAQRADLTELAWRLHLLHDLEAAFADRYEIFPVQFEDAWARESEAVHDLLLRYGLTDPSTAHPPGRFADRSVQADYDRLRARGDTGRAAAVDAVAEVLHHLLAILDAALPHMSARDVHHAYVQLCAATIRQLAAVQKWTAR